MSNLSSGERLNHNFPSSEPGSNGPSSQDVYKIWSSLNQIREQIAPANRSSVIDLAETVVAQEPYTKRIHIFENLLRARAKQGDSFATSVINNFIDRSASEAV